MIHCTVTSVPRPERPPPPVDLVRSLPCSAFSVSHTMYCPGTSDKPGPSRFCNHNVTCNFMQLDAVGPRRLLKYLVGAFLLYADRSCLTGSSRWSTVMLLAVFNAVYLLICFPQLLVRRVLLCSQRAAARETAEQSTPGRCWTCIWLAVGTVVALTQAKHV